MNVEKKINRCRIMNIEKFKWGYNLINWYKCNVLESTR